MIISTSFTGSLFGSALCFTVLTLIHSFPFNTWAGRTHGSAWKVIQKTLVTPVLHTNGLVATAKCDNRNDWCQISPYQLFLLVAQHASLTPVVCGLNKSNVREKLHTFPAHHNEQQPAVSADSGRYYSGELWVFYGHVVWNHGNTAADGDTQIQKKTEITLLISAS